MTKLGPAAVLVLATVPATLECAAYDFAIQYKNKTVFTVSGENNTCSCGGFRTSGTVLAGSVQAGDVDLAELRVSMTNLGHLVANQSAVISAQSAELQRQRSIVDSLSTALAHQNETLRRSNVALAKCNATLADLEQRLSFDGNVTVFHGDVRLANNSLQIGQYVLNESAGIFHIGHNTSAGPVIAIDGRQRGAVDRFVAFRDANGGRPYFYVSTTGYSGWF